MSRIDDLIDDLAPNGVQFVTLAAVAKTRPGLSGKTKSDFSDGNARFVSYKNVFANLAVQQDASDFVKVGANEKQNLLHEGDVIFTGSSETADEVGMSSVVMTEPTAPLYLNSFCFVVRFDDPALVLPAFSKYLFRSDSVRSQIRRTASGVTRINISKRRFMEVRIPVPPLEVQGEIVRVLDAFCALEHELEEELQVRRRQFIAYRDRLPLTTYMQELCGDGIEQVPLGAIATQYVDPVRVHPDETYVNLGVKWYGEGAFAREPKAGKDIKGTTLYRVKPGQFIYNRMFVTEGSFGLIDPALADGVVSNEFPVYDLDPTRIVPEWLFLKFQDTATVRAVAAETTGGTKSRRRWKENQFEAFLIDLPPLAAQRETVRILSTFSDLQAELRAELVARKAQYGYYRDRLLTFEESVA